MNKIKVIKAISILIYAIVMLFIPFDFEFNAMSEYAVAKPVEFIIMVIFIGACSYSIISIHVDSSNY